jgi:NAD(P)-dependent dehydrogenase (short-subunit alcohol dehydrogenase family)
LIQSAIITGAASGIGLALAQALAGRGARVILADIELERAQNAAAGIGENATALAVDHADEASIVALADAAFAQFGTVDAVFANAGVGAGGPIHTTPQRNVDWVLAVNLMGPLWLARHFVPRMAARPERSHFVVTGSEHSLGLPPRGGTASVYTLSKHAVLGFAETLRRDLADTPVDVGIVCPAVVTTDIWNPLRNRHERFGGPRIVAEQPQGQIGLDPETAAARILDGIAAGEFYLLTHDAEIAEVHVARSGEISAAIERLSARLGKA